jgi:hypothetical protein
MVRDDASRGNNDERADLERRIRYSPTARAAHGQLGAWLDLLGARYAGCAVDDQGDRTARWVFPRGSQGASKRRWRELLACSLGGDRDRWELVYREVGESRWLGTVYHYASTSSRGDLAWLESCAAELVDAGLRHVSRPVATCGHDQLDPRVLPGLTAVVACVLLVASLWLSWPVLVLWSFALLLIGAVGWFAVCVRLVAVGLRW